MESHRFHRPTVDVARLPKELSSVMPLYSAIASARLISNLAMESQSWGLVPNGEFVSSVNNSNQPTSDSVDCSYSTLPPSPASSAHYNLRFSHSSHSQIELQIIEVSIT